MAHEAYALIPPSPLADGEIATLSFHPVVVRLERRGTVLIVTLTRYTGSITDPRVERVERFVLTDAS
jgi:hypothetical protein